VTLIELFEVPPERDEAFLADWRAARAGATLYRALRDDVPVRFVSIARDGGSYELVHEDGAVDERGGVTLITPLDITADAEPEFLRAWHEARDATARHRGYLGTRLYRSGSRFITVARWSSPLMVARAFTALPALYQPVARSS
jgi:hypothetical protein